MSAREIRVELTPELRGRVEEAIATGDYTSANDVIPDALQHWLRKVLSRGKPSFSFGGFGTRALQAGPRGTRTSKR